MNLGKFLVLDTYMLFWHFSASYIFDKNVYLCTGLVVQRLINFKFLVLIL